MSFKRWIKIDKNKIDYLLSEINEISKIIASIIIKLKKSNSNIIKEKYIQYGSDSFDDLMISLNNEFSSIDKE
ncbi:MAG: hypothetical protein WBV81_08330 [Ignavibacteriaceae bacterium]